MDILANCYTLITRRIDTMEVPSLPDVQPQSHNTTRESMPLQ